MPEVQIAGVALCWACAHRQQSRRRGAFESHRHWHRICGNDWWRHSRPPVGYPSRPVVMLLCCGEVAGGMKPKFRVLAAQSQWCKAPATERWREKQSRQKGRNKRVVGQQTGRTRPWTRGTVTPTISDDDELSVTPRKPNPACSPFLLYLILSGT